MTKEKSKEQLRKWEHLVERRCLVCDKSFVTKVYWAYGGKNPLRDCWIINSVYCSTKCSRKGHKIFKEGN